MILISSLFFIFNLINTFPFDENFSKIYYVGFNTHYFYHITKGKISEIFSIPKIQECVIEECKDKYQNSPPSFWLSLIFIFIPKKYHPVAFSISYLISSFILLFFSIRFCIKRDSILIFLIIPYISSLLIRFMMTGGIIFHILPSIFCIIGWECLKNFQEKKQNKYLIYTSIANAIACIMNITFIIPVMITYITHIKDIKRKFYIPALFLVLISPMYIIYIHQNAICFPPEWHKIYTQEILKNKAHINLIYSIKIMVKHSPIVPAVGIFSMFIIISAIGKKEIRKDTIISLILIIATFSPLIPGPGTMLKGVVFSPRFEMIPVFIMCHIIYKKFFNSKYVKIGITIFGIISSIQTVKTKDSVFTLKNFPYEPLKNLAQKIIEIEQDDTVLIETLGNMLISEDTYLLSLETGREIKGLFMDVSSIVLKGDNVTYACGKSIISEPILSFLEKFKIDYVICKTTKCRITLSQTCINIEKYKIGFLPVSFEIFKCKKN